MKTLVDQRDCGRRRVLRGGTIAFSGRHSTLSCVVRDISDGGARLQVEQPLSVPDTFELLVDLDGIEVNCAVMWRGAKDIGVAFTKAPRFGAPRRLQVVAPGSAGAVEAETRKSVRRTEAPRAATASKKFFEPDPAQFEASDKPIMPLLIAEDDPDDRLLISEAFQASRVPHAITFVPDGEAMLAILRGTPGGAAALRPGLILLDLNMPRMDGRTALMHLKTDRDLRRIPVVALTTSSAEEDIERTYELGVSAYLEKPSSHEDMIELVQSIDKFWMRRVSYPASA